MTALLTRTPVQPPVSREPDRRVVLPGQGGPEWFRRATSIPVLAAAMVVVTVLAIWPLQSVDRALDEQWIRETAPSLVPFLQDVLDRIAGQQVNLTVLSVVAVVLAWRKLTWRPIVLAVLTEAGFYSAGLLKILFARPAPSQHDPSFFAGGLFSVGREGISYPSGHAAESVLVYGVIVYLIVTYARTSPAVDRLLRWAWGLVVLNAVVVSFLLGYHWVTDLVGGLVYGALLLRIIIRLDRGPASSHKASVTHSAP